ncbi:MAG: bacillithiol biosynthesis cysteine-adding enzyme BshC [Putridiphycobacter sp.]
MQNNTFSFTEFNFSSQIIRDLTDENSKVNPFIDSFFNETNILNQIKKKSFSSENRQILTKALADQNHSILLSESSQKNLKLLEKENSFTITTGHQLNLLTGPLYSIYKILQVIVWAEKLNHKYPDYNFIPMFLMATEDHDFEEINHLHLFQNKIEYLKSDQLDYIAGKIKINSNFHTEVKTQILDLFNDEKIKVRVEHFLNFYTEGQTLAEATRGLLNDLFGKYGLLIIDGDDSNLKKLFAPIVQKELSDQITFDTVKQTNEKLIKAGYHNQVYLRESNLFYIKNGNTRQRIVKVENGFTINDQFKTGAELLNTLDNCPECFSPNALLRPVYQEMILPNLVYLGGGGEIAYWLQLKDLFDKLGISFPLLRVRDSYILLNKRELNQIDSLEFSITELKTHFDELSKIYVKQNTTKDLSLETEKLQLTNLKNEVLNKANGQDVGLTRFIEGEFAKMKNQFEKIEKKLVQSEKKNQEKGLKQLQKIQQKIYPNQGFQERYENFLQYIHLPNFIDELKKELDQFTTNRAQIKVISI